MSKVKVVVLPGPIVSGAKVLENSSGLATWATAAPDTARASKAGSIAIQSVIAWGFVLFKENTSVRFASEAPAGNDVRALLWVGPRRPSETIRHPGNALVRWFQTWASLDAVGDVVSSYLEGPPAWGILLQADVGPVNFGW